MHTLSITTPAYIRNKKFTYKVGKVEQGIEKLHKKFNDLESNYTNIIDKPLKSFYKIKRFELNQSSDKICYPHFRKKIKFL